MVIKELKTQQIEQYHIELKDFIKISEKFKDILDLEYSVINNYEQILDQRLDKFIEVNNIEIIPIPKRNFISDLIEYRVIELLPKIKKLFDLEIVGLMICGDYKEVSEEISKEIPEEISNVEIEPYATLTDVYEDYRKRWPLPSETTKNTPSNFDADLYSSFDDVHKEKPIRVSKIGRNEPCPCGSGKKYKKCCLNS